MKKIVAMMLALMLVCPVVFFVMNRIFAWGDQLWLKRKAEKK